METYQPIFDAVRSRLSNGNIGAAVESAIRDENIGHYIQQVVASADEHIADVVSAHMRPSAIFRPALSIDGNQWCALYGEDLQNGVAGFGVSPDEAMRDFDKNWIAKLP